MAFRTVTSNVTRQTRSFATSSRCSLVGVPPRNVLVNPEEDPDIHIGPLQMNRYEEHYRNTLAPSLLYMTYDPDWASLNASERRATGSSDRVTRQWDPNSPYSKNRPLRPAKGLRNLQPGARAPDFTNPTKDLVQLEKLVVSSFCAEAVANKNALLPLITQMRNITGVSPRASHADPIQGLVDKPGGQKDTGRGHIGIVRTSSRAASFKVRQGVPVGVRAELPRPLAYNFLEILVTFVLPRLRQFPGFVLPPASQPAGTPAEMSGSVSLGLGPEAMPLFPQLEINWDAYPNKALGLQVSDMKMRPTSLRKTVLTICLIPLSRIVRLCH